MFFLSRFLLESINNEPEQNIAHQPILSEAEEVDSEILQHGNRVSILGYIICAFEFVSRDIAMTQMGDTVSTQNTNFLSKRGRYIVIFVML